MLKGIAEKVLRRFRRLRGMRGADSNDLAYPWLNAQLLELMGADAGVQRANYTWGILHATHLARALDVERISAIELGVAGGNGLQALEAAAERAGRRLGVRVDVYGFDMGSGLPPPTD